MTKGQTKNAALTTALAFHYQALIGLERCFSLQDDQSILFEKDGDVSLIGDDVNTSEQVEVKNYAAPLTDHHENLWKTLKNWLASDFDHTRYGSLVLLTTQKFGEKTTLNDWNTQSSSKRLDILREIYSTRTPEELNADKPKDIVKLQKVVMTVNEIDLIAILEKVVLCTEAENEDQLFIKIISKLQGIPENNKERYLQGLVGFIYGNANNLSWKISKLEFNAECEELTSTYCKKEYTFPPFVGSEASDKEVTEHKEALFVQKINDIEYFSVIPDAVGNWIELQNSLSEELDEYPRYKKKTEDYQKQLIKSFKLNYSTASLSSTESLKDSKIFYNQMITEHPLNTESFNPPIEYKNGLIHDALDDEEQDLQWNVKS